MDKILGIISEYNPFHYGHLYHLEESKKKVNPDYTVCIMSGNFTQRGDAAIVDKWSRTKMALGSGIDLVIELPLLYSISSAENFAIGGVKILDSFNIDTTLSFGSECGNLELLNKIADVLVSEPQEYLNFLNSELSTGLSYPKARENALIAYLDNDSSLAYVLSESNNILGIEYLKAMKKINSNLSAITLSRKDSKYNSNSLESKYASASAIREALLDNIDISSYMPKPSFVILQEKVNNKEFINGLKSFEQAIIYKLRTMTVQEIKELPDVSEGLENKIKKAADECNNLKELIEKIKSKRYTLTRINRILLYALLGITKQDITNSSNVIPYIRVLGMNSKGKELLSKIKNKNSNLNIITSPKKFLDTSNDLILKNILLKDIQASNIYTLGYKQNSKANLDYTNKIITL